MPTPDNATEWQWLRHEPDRLLTHYQPVVAATVMRFFRRGFFAQEEKQELVQEVNLELLERKLGAIAQHYDGSVLLRTYFARVVYNVLVDRLRKQKRQAHTVNLTDALPEQIATHPTPEQSLLLRDEMYRLEALLRLLPQRYRSILCLKGWARIVLTPSDLQHYVAPRTQEAVTQVRRFLQPYDSLRDPEVFGPLAQLLELVEQRTIVPDSLRRWTDLRAVRLTDDLNRSEGGTTYTKALCKTLLRYYYEHFTSAKR